MGRTKIKVDLSSAGLAYAQQAVRQYKRDLQAKCRLFLDRLADFGIDVARTNAAGDQDDYGDYLVFRKDMTDLRNGVQCILVVTSGIIKSEWLDTDGTTTKSADVSPLLMLEFGAGIKNKQNKNAGKFGMGPGTFPGQTHAKSPTGWYYQTTDGVWHHSYGHKARMPVQKAANRMIRHVRISAKEAFK